MPGPDKIAEMQKIFQNSREYTHLQVRSVVKRNLLCRLS